MFRKKIKYGALIVPTLVCCLAISPVHAEQELYVASASLCHGNPDCGLTELRDEASKNSSVAVIDRGNIVCVVDCTLNIQTDDKLTKAGAQLLSNFTKELVDSAYASKFLSLDWVKEKTGRDALDVVIKGGQEIEAIPASTDPLFKDLQFLFSYGAAIKVFTEKGETEWMGFYDYGRNSAIPDLVGKPIANQPIPALSTDAFTKLSSKQTVMKSGRYSLDEILDLLPMDQDYRKSVSISKLIQDKSVYVSAGQYDSAELILSALNALNLKVRKVENMYFISPQVAEYAADILAGRVLGRYELPDTLAFNPGDFRVGREFKWNDLSDKQVDFIKILLQISGWGDKKDFKNARVVLKNGFWIQFFYEGRDGRFHEFDSQVF